MNDIKGIALFEGKEIRKTWHDEKWYFSVSDIVSILTDSQDVKQYIKRMRERDNELSINWGTICTLLEVVSKDGRKRKENTANLEGMFRIIQSIPSPKAEPIRLWLARVGTERLEEIQDPELAMDRAKGIFEKKGYSKDWIDKRMRGINIRHSLTDEWKNRGVKKGFEFAILTDEIYRGTFNITAQEYKKHKSLDKENNLRDHMNDIELILTMLGEATTTRLTQDRDSKEFNELQNDATDGGEVAGRTRKDIESKTKKKVITKENFLPKVEGLKGK
jgi:prophage antirepressor-like protein